MGVPKFYRWISERYPQINQMISGSCILPEFDNFYLDMNGIIHACTHPNDNQTANSLSMREMILAIFRYIDRMVTEIVKPKKILFMAIDGVAPRAKLNQQRARRFRAAQDREESIAKALQKGETIDLDNMFDSNCITPGTEFMEIVGNHLRWFIRKKVKDDPIWRNLRIVFSGHDVPGEGEHKIMQFIRDLRNDPSYEPNQRHCMYGQDADLIMLGLASHEPHFALLREVVDFSGGRGKQTVLRQTKDAQFQLLHLSILREYLTLDFALDCTWSPDQERLIDDFIFLTFLVGNDFLPHLPTLDIGEHAFDLLIRSYRQLMNESPGYIVHNGDIGDLARLEKLFGVIGSQEQQILQSREEEVKKMNTKRRKFKDAVVVSEEELEEAEDALQRAYEAAIRIAMGKGDESDEDWIDVSGLKVSTPSDEDEEQEEGLVVNKDYRGRYYYEKFKVVPSTVDGQVLLSDVMSQYLKGLMWVLAYYVKGCISWTWYYPYHYGPMLQDMTGLEQMSTQYHFTLGQPFRPFQQLLGCLPPASAKLLPRPYQWLMTSAESPVLAFYPLEFGIDQDGKKNPWEAVVLLDFINEVKLLEAEAAHCPENKLTSAERHRNAFGTVSTCVYDPSNVETYFSCSPEFGLPDIHSCQSSLATSVPSLAPGAFFKPELVPGTTYPIAGFPSLTVLPLTGCKVEAVKVNMFGSDSKYQSLVLELKSPQIDNLESLNAELLLGRTVYVNYPQIHEARVVAISTEREEYRLEKQDGSVTVVKRVHDEITSQRWRKEAHEEETKYLKGRGTPGTGGLVVGDIKIRLRVSPLQGLQRDPITGASKKVYAASSEADVPVQLALWSPPVRDTRFEETDELSVDLLMPHGASVLALTGKLLGCKGKVVGPHLPETAANRKLQESLGSVPKKLKRVVDVEFTLPQPEPPFGYSIASSVVEEYFSTKDLCASLAISPSVLGKLVGSIKVDVGRSDIGLNLKRNGQYQLLGFARRVEQSEGGEQKRKVWTGVDTIQIIGTIDSNPDAAAEADGCYWEYSVRAATLIFDYKMKFPRLFANLERLPHQPVYEADELLDSEGKQKIDEINAWLQSQPYFKMSRTPFSTTSLSRDAMAAIERAADVYVAANVSKGVSTVTVKGITLDSVYCDAHRSSSDIALPYNVLEPRLGDRVVNMTTIGVPFGLRGTVVTIHSSTKYVEAIFDEEFIGGKGLQGNCSQFRGHLCPWSGLLLVSRHDEYREFLKNKANGKSSAGSRPAPTAPRSTSAPASTPSIVPVKVLGKTIAADSAKSLSLLQALKPSANSETVTVQPSKVVASNNASKAQALMGVLRDRTAESKAASLLGLLKQQLDVTEEEELHSLHAQTAGVTQSNGSGRVALAAAAGFEADSDLVASLLPSSESHQQEDPLLGVISFLPTDPSASSAPHPAATVATSSAAVSSEPAKRIAINKEASQRVVKHQLQPNFSADKQGASQQKANKPVKGEEDVAAAQSDTAGKSIEHLLKTAKKAPPTGTPHHGVVNSSPESPAVLVAAKEQPPAASKPKSIAALLANAKKVLATKTASPVPITEDNESKSAAVNATKTSGTGSIAHLLLNAKKHSDMPSEPAATGPVAEKEVAVRSITDILAGAKKTSTAAPSTAAPAQQQVTEGKSITSILSNAKRLAGHSVVATNTEADSTSSNVPEEKRAPDSSIASLFANAKKIPAAAVNNTAGPASITTVTATHENPVKSDSSALEQVMASVGAKKKSAGLVPTKVLLSKTAAKN